VDVGDRVLQLLLLEDSAEDAELIVSQLERDRLQIAWHRVDTEATYRASLDSRLDVIIADYNIPSFGAPSALEILKASGLDVPLIVVSGSIGEETAVRMLQTGAADYFLKDRLSRLSQAIRRATEERRLRRERVRAQETLRIAEERTQFALQAAQVGIWETDLLTGSSHWSSTLEAQHGMAPGGFGGTYQAFMEAIHPDDRAKVRDAVEQATARRTDSHILYRTIWPDGTLHWISGVGHTFYDDSGKPVRAAGIGMDVTERRLLEEQYRQSQKMEAIGQLAGGVAHDFNNLLSVILGYCGVLIDALGPENPHQEDLGEIRQAAESAAGLTRQLLAFSRRQLLEPRVIDIRTVLHDMELMLKRLIGEHITLDVRTAQHVSHVKVDPNQVQQVILNLALNARDAMPNGGTLLVEVKDVELDSTFARQHSEIVAGPHVALIVSDTGEGMDAATRARVFEPFFTTKNKGRGTGLGLSTVYGIVKQSNGSIWVYSEPGRGSTFKIFFPSVEALAAQPAAPLDIDFLRGSETIMVVEDEVSLGELLRRCLALRGYEVLAASTPREAIEIEETHTGPLHLLITDVVMPEMNGRDLADYITNKRPDTRVLFMSGYTDDAVVGRGLVENGTPFLQKPFTPDAVARKVREILGVPPDRTEGSQSPSSATI
jgi:PAS domain S-box-containing protein